MFAGHTFASKIAKYREPGHSGYLVVDDETGKSGAVEDSMQKYYEGCLNSTTGEMIECEMSIGGSYTECINNCEYIKCADASSQTNCTLLFNSTEREECESNTKYCIHYEIKKVTNETMKRGFISRGVHCINSYGVPDETPGMIVKKDDNELGNCTFGDGETLVELGGVVGDFACCGGDLGEVCNGTLAGLHIDAGEVCNGTLAGLQKSHNYDPRVRMYYCVE